MHQLMGMLGGGHGHSHAPGTECSGHGHGGAKKEMTEEMRAALLRKFEAHMELMKASQGGGHVLHPGRVLHNPTSPDPGPYNHLLYGYGHEPDSMPHGWGSLAPTPPPMINPTMPLNLEDMMLNLGPVERDRFWLLKVPWFGRVRVVKDKAGLLQASGVVLYWLYGNWSTWNAILLPYYADGILPLFVLFLYAVVSVLCITSFVRASTLNPGSLHVDSQPQADWDECKVCLIQRPPLSHHCRRCGHCVRRMDHHCPWINNCVGEENQFSFMLLLLYAFLLSCSTLAVQLLYFFAFDVCVTCDKESFIVRYQNPIIYADVIIAILMLLSSFGLICNQHISVIHEIPTVEWMKMQRDMFLAGKLLTEMPEGKRPMCDIYADLCGAPVYCWLLPCRRRQRPSVAGTTVGV